MCGVAKAHFCGLIMHFMCSHPIQNGSVVVQRDDLSICADTSFPMLGVCAPLPCGPEPLAYYFNGLDALNTTQGFISQTIWKGMCIPPSVFQGTCNGATSYFRFSAYCEDDTKAADSDMYALALLWIIGLLALACIVGTIMGALGRRGKLNSQKASDPLSLVDFAEENRVVTIPSEGVQEAGSPLIPQYRQQLPCGLGAFLWFDMYENTMSLIDHRPQHEHTNFLNGFRVISMLWVILGHTIYFGFIVPGNYGNLMDVIDFMNSGHSLLIQSAVYAVDTFFFLSGFFETHLFVRRSVKIKQFGLMYMHRYLRITPTMVFVMFFMWWLVPHMAEGPLWYSLVNAKGLTDECPSRWWQHLLYISALMPSDGSLRSCMSWYWFLSDDMVFFIIAPWLLYLFLRSATKTVAIVLIGAIHLTTIGLAVGHNVVHIPLDRSLYDKPYVRASPFLFGIYTALLLEHDGFREWLKTTWHRWSLYLLSAAYFITCIVVTWDVMHRKEDEAVDAWASRLGTFVYMGFWGQGLMFLSLCLYTSHGNIVKSFLGHSTWDTLGKLTFGVYLIHPLIMVLNTSSQKDLPSFSTFWLLTHFAGYTVWSYVFSFCLYLLVEKPGENASKALWRPSKRPAKK
jgi:peptidoglycan/LPS O-acetylase OafA/YrhL